ncbi:ABC transporter permease [Candidatus Woesearchaeota archaeon]|nr:ABC transporter permease [Candidatus Woesearchaeota archaeon]
MLLDYAKLASNSLKKRKTRTYLTMIGIFIGIAAVVSLIGLGEGLRAAIMGQFGFLGPDVLGVQASGLNFAGPPGTAVVTPLTDDLADKIERIPGVEAAINRYLESGTMEFNDRQVIGFSYSVPEGEDRKVFERMLNLEVAAGRPLKDGDRDKIVVGNDFTLDSMFGKGVRVGDRLLFQGHTFEVVGVLKKKGSFIFDGSLAMNEGILKDLFRKGDDTVNVIGVKVRDVKDVGRVKEDIEDLMRKERDVEKGEEDFEVSSPQQTLETLDSTLFAVQLFVAIIAGISIVVGGIGIMNTMYTAVLERTKEIGIMKAVGAKNSAIFTLFFIESGLLGLLGGAIGVLLGLGLAYGLAFAGRALLHFDLIRAQVSLALILGALAFSFVIGLVAGLVPAWQASRKNPVDALRFVK